jgi:hypothetical protein
MIPIRKLVTVGAAALAAGAAVGAAVTPVLAYIGHQHNETLVRSAWRPQPPAAS